MPDPHLAIADQVIARCRELARCTEVPGQTTRLPLCPAMAEAHTRLRPWMERAGLHVRLDAAGNLRGHRPAATPEAPTLLLGSHLDTVPNAGAFDGVLGVLLALAAIETAGPLPFHIELLAFAEEEGVRFGKPFLGSLALIGELDTPTLALTDRDGTTVANALRTFGAPLHDLPAALLPPDTLGYLELHIEQGPVLDHRHLALGIVTAIVGQTRARLTFTGTANHAGTTPMPLRHDALAAAAAWNTAAEHLARSTPHLVATVGHLLAEPNAPNVIPSRVLTTLDLRHPDDPTRNAAFATLLASATHEAHTRGVHLTHQLTLDQPAVPMHPHLTSLLQQAAPDALPMHSGAGHDAMVLARRTPTAMLFLRSPGGLSHHPDETVFPEDVAAALRATTRFLHLLAANPRALHHA